MKTAILIFSILVSFLAYGEDFDLIFPNQKILSCVPLSGGFSGAKIYKVNVDGKDYIVRYSIGSLAQEFAAQEIASNEGICPKVVYSDPKKGIVAMEFIANQLDCNLRAIPGSFENLAKLIRKLHTQENLNPLICKRVALDDIKSVYQKIPQNFLDDKDQALLDRIVETPWPSSALVLCHNDFHTGNLLYDGDRFWLIDFETAGLSHPFYDLAYFANFQLMNREEGNEFLSVYLERGPSEKECQDFNLLRRIAFGFNAAMLLRAVTEIDVKTPKPLEVELNSLEDFFTALALKKIDLSQKRDSYRAALLFLQASESY